MLSFPEPRPTGPVASFSRHDLSEYDHNPFHSPNTPTHQKDLPQIPSAISIQTSTADQYPIEEKKGIKWWWKTSSRKEKERRKSLGIGSSRTSYHVDHLSHGLDELRIGSTDSSGSSAKQIDSSIGSGRDAVGHFGNYTNETNDITSASDPSTPPPIPPRPRAPTAPRWEPNQPQRHNQASPTKIYRKYDPPPLQVPARYSAAWIAPPQTRPAAPAGIPAYQPQQSGYALGAHDTRLSHSFHAPSLPHSATAPSLYNSVSNPSHLTPSHRSSMPIMGAPPILSPSHRPNMSSLSFQPGVSPYSMNTSRMASLGPITPNSKKTYASDAQAPTTRNDSPARGIATGTSQQCAGYTKQGKRCKRMVRNAAPYAVIINDQIEIINGSKPVWTSPGSKRSDTGQANEQENALGGAEPRFCRDHAKSICEAEGFYWKGGQREKWVNFADWIPDDLEEQTKVLLRLTMESALTNKESKGFIYAYELRDLQTSNVAYYKVGRTENVPRRLDEWKKRCSSHHPTLRDVFPLDDGDGPGQSMLPGAMQGGIHADLAARKTSPAVKRLERLIHIELAAHAAKGNHGRQRYACPDCQTFHQEIFGIEVIPFRGTDARASGWEYEKIVKTAILRWDAFVREIMD